MPANQQPTDRQLHRLVDGDLTPTERAALLAVTGEERVALVRKVEGLGEVRALVRAAADAELEREALDADAMWAQISARVEGSRESQTFEVLTGASAVTAPPSATPTLQVIRGGRAEERHERNAERRADPQMDERQKRVRARRYGMALVGGLAAAAALGIVYLNPMGNATVATPEVAPETPPETLELQASAELQQTEVLAVDFGQNVGTVFSIEGDEGARYAVVWLADESEKDDDTQAPGDGTKSPVEL